VLDKDGVVKLLPVFELVPPVDDVYQFIDPADAVAVKEVVPDSQIFPSV
jgi:hypothetical protein